MGLTFHLHNLLFEYQHLMSGQSVRGCFFAHPCFCPLRPTLLFPMGLELDCPQPGHLLGQVDELPQSSSRRFLWQPCSQLKGHPVPPPPGKLKAIRIRVNRALQRQNELRGAQITAELFRMEPSLILSEPEAYTNGPAPSQTALPHCYLRSDMSLSLSLGFSIRTMGCNIAYEMPWFLAHSQSEQQ